MTETSNKKQYDLEDRTLTFSKKVRKFVDIIPSTIANREDIKQLVRSSGSIGANYREANDSLGKKDFLMKIKICRKEAKETVYWLNLLEVPTDVVSQHSELLQESEELMKIFGAILKKSQ